MQSFSFGSCDRYIDSLAVHMIISIDPEQQCDVKFDKLTNDRELQQSEVESPSVISALHLFHQILYVEWVFRYQCKIKRGGEYGNCSW